MKEQVTKFNLEAAFKALEEIEIPQVYKSKRLSESVSFAPATDCLLEDYYDVSNKNDLENAEAQRAKEVAQAKLARIEKIVDLEADSVEDLQPSYVGKTIIQCPQCMTLFYRKPEDIHVSEENSEVVNVSEGCPNCGNDSGYTIIGKVAAEEVEETPVEEETAEEPAVEEESTEEVEAEAAIEELPTAEDAAEDMTKNESLNEEKNNEEFPNPEKHELVDTVNGIKIYLCKDCKKYVALVNDKKIKRDSLEELVQYIKDLNLKEALIKNSPLNVNVDLHDFGGNNNDVDVLNEEMDEYWIEPIEDIAYLGGTNTSDIKAYIIKNGLKDTVKYIKVNYDSNSDDDAPLWWDIELLDSNQKPVDHISWNCASGDTFEYDEKYYKENDLQEEGLLPELPGLPKINLPGLGEEVEQKEALIKDSPVNINIDAHKFGGANNNVDVMNIGKKLGRVISEDEDLLDEDIIAKDAPKDEKDIQLKQRSVGGNHHGKKGDIPNSIIDEAKKLNEDDNITSAEVNELLDSSEFKSDISDAEVDGLLARAHKNVEESVLEALEETHDASLTECITNSLIAVYENVDSFELTNCKICDNQFIVEGKINFKSGLSKNTRYVFTEAASKYKYRFTGINEDLGKDSTFVLTGTLQDEKKVFYTESLKYKYNIGNNLVEGLSKIK